VTLVGAAVASGVAVAGSRVSVAGNRVAVGVPGLTTRPITRAGGTVCVEAGGVPIDLALVREPAHAGSEEMATSTISVAVTSVAMALDRLTR
jgi:hypothetical protein